MGYIEIGNKVLCTLLSYNLPSKIILNFYADIYYTIYSGNFIVRVIIQENAIKCKSC